MELPPFSVQLKAGIWCREIMYQTNQSITLPFGSDFQSLRLFSCFPAGWLSEFHGVFCRISRLRLLVFHTPPVHSYTGSHKLRQTPSCMWQQSQGFLLVHWSNTLCSFWLCKSEQQELQPIFMWTLWFLLGAAKYSVWGKTGSPIHVLCIRFCCLKGMEKAVATWGGEKALRKRRKYIHLSDSSDTAAERSLQSYLSSQVWIQCLCS